MTKSVRDLKSIRQLAIEDAYKECGKLNGAVHLTGHFIERINLRCDDQNRTFLFFAKAFNHLLKNREKHVGQCVEYKSVNDTIVFRINDKSDPRARAFLHAADFQVVAITYWFNSADCQQLKDHGTSDVIYRIAS